MQYFVITYKGENLKRNIYVKNESEVSQSCLTLCDLMDYSLPGSSFHGIFQQEYLSELPFPSPGDLHHLGIKPRSPAFQAGALPSETPVKPQYMCVCICIYIDIYIDISIYITVVFT